MEYVLYDYGMEVFAHRVIAPRMPVKMTAAQP